MMNYCPIVNVARHHYHYQAPLRSRITSSIRRRPLTTTTTTSFFTTTTTYCKHYPILTTYLPIQRSSMSTTSPSAVSSTPPVCTLTSLDHFVLTVRSLPETIKFYTEILGMAHQSFNSPANPTVTRHALLFGGCKINLHQAGKEFEPKARTALPGTADLCFLTDQDVGTVLERLMESGVEVLEVEDGKQLVRRVGARSPLRSLYVRDPDGNLIEISNPTTA